MGRNDADSWPNSLFDLGFEHGAEAAEDPTDIEFRSRVPEYQVGYIVGRSFSEAVRQVSYQTAISTAGKLGVRFGVSLEDLLKALRLTEADERHIREAYGQQGCR